MVGGSIQFQSLQHVELGFRARSRAFLVRCLVCGTGREQVGPKSLKFDGIGAAGFGRVNQSHRQIERSVVVYASLGNDEYPWHRDALFYSASRSANINSGLRQITHDRSTGSDHATTGDLDPFYYCCSSANHREATDRDAP